MNDSKASPDVSYSVLEFVSTLVDSGDLDEIDKIIDYCKGVALQ